MRNGGNLELNVGGEVKSRYADDETSMELWLHFNPRDYTPKITMSDVPQLSGSQIMRDCPITGCSMDHGLRTQSAELRDVLLSLVRVPRTSRPRERQAGGYVREKACERLRSQQRLNFL